MDNHLKLISGQKYRVVKPFADYDKRIHQIGELWTYIGTNFVPYHDGLTLHVLQNGVETVYRFLWDETSQAEIIEHFSDYVELVHL